MPYGITESQPTVEPGAETYSTRKIAVERIMLDAAPTLILRPCAVHGIGSTHPRERWFVKRALDVRKVVPLAYEGSSRFHPTSTLTLARFVRFALSRNLTGPYNVADAPSVAEIGTAIGSALGARCTLVPIDGDDIGGTPWPVPRPFVLDTGRAFDAGFTEATTYVERLREMCFWLIEAAKTRDWRDVFSVLAGYPENLFDYDFEDRILAQRATP